MALTDEIKKKIDEWTQPPYGQDCIDEIKQLVADGNEAELTERFGADLEFGTGGLRGIIRNGTNGMNRYNIAKATQGLANYTLKNGGADPKAVIAYDSRKFSPEFAKETAVVLASNGIKTYLFEALRPTPELSFAVKHLGCTTGVVITASHNPKEYNGYKAYWNDGSQVIAPHDKGIIEEVRGINSLNDVKNEGFEALLEKGMIEMVGEKVDEAFIDEIMKLAIRKDEIKGSDVKIVFTPLHGTGATLIPQAVKRLGMPDLICVPEQMEPDSSFSTVDYPNPEEPKALKMAIDLAEKSGAELVIATDPDADRMGIAVKTRNGEFQVVSGNQIGAILEYYVLKERKAMGTLPANGAVVKTIVTTNLQDEIGKSFGVKVFNTLTGFKYIGQKIRHFEADGDYRYVFGGEESYGYLTGVHARDKDAVAASVMIAECAAFLKKDGKNLVDLLDEIFDIYGFYTDKTISKTIKGLSGRAMIGRIMEHYRANPRKEVGGVKVARAIDYANEQVADAEESKYCLDSSNVLQYLMEDGSKVTLRPSGTEPKIKFYFSTKGESSEAAEAKVEGFANDFISEVEEFIKQNS